MRKLLAALFSYLPALALASALGSGTNDFLTGQLTTDVAAVGTTIAAKVKYTTHPAAIDNVVQLADTNASNSSSLHLRLSSTDDRFDCTTFDTGGVADSALLTSGAAEYDGVWFSIVCTFTADDLRQIDVGIPAASETPSTNVQSSDSADTLNNIRLFESFVGAGDMAGRIAEVAIWDTILDSTEIEAYIDNECTANIAAANLRAYYPLVDDADDFANDGLDATGDLTVTASVSIDADHPTMGSCSAPPTFDSNTTVSAETTDTYTLSYNASADAVTFFAAAKVKDAAAPADCDAVEAGTGAVATASEATTGGSDTTDLAIPGGDPFPLYDIYSCLENAAGDSSLVTLVDETLDEPTGRTYFIKSGDPEGAEIGLFDSASPAAANDDYGDCSETSDSFELGAAAHVLTCAVDTTFVIESGGDLSRQIITRRFYDVSIADWSDADPVELAINDIAPAYIGLSLDYQFVVDDTLDYVLDTDWLDMEDDAVTHGWTNIPSGGTIADSETLTGAFDTCGNYDTMIWTATDQYGEATTLSTFVVKVGALVPDFAGDDEATYVAEVEALCPSITATVSEEFSSSVPAGQVASVSPAVGEFLEHDDGVEVVVSLGESVEAGDIARKVIFELPNVVGMTVWVDYVPVSVVADCRVGTYEEDGCWAVTPLSEATGTAWVDYTPVFEVAQSANKWRYENDGWIPVDTLTP